MKHLRPGTLVRFLPDTPDEGEIMTYTERRISGDAMAKTFPAVVHDFEGKRGIAMFEEFEPIPTLSTDLYTFNSTWKHLNRNGMSLSIDEEFRAVEDAERFTK